MLGEPHTVNEFPPYKGCRGRLVTASYPRARPRIELQNRLWGGNGKMNRDVVTKPARRSINGKGGLREKSEGRSKVESGIIFLTLSVTVILAATLSPLPHWQGEKNEFFTLLSNADAVQDAFENCVLFLPLGVALSFRVVRAYPSAFLGAFLSILVETLQSQIPGRDPSLRDIAFNVLGTVFGFWVGHSPLGSGLARFLDHGRLLWERCKRPTPELAGRFSLGAALLSCGLLSLGGWLLSPSYLEAPYVSAGKDVDGGSSVLRIGAAGRDKNHYRGAIDEARVYARALTQSEIQADMRTPVSVKQQARADLVAAYGFDDAEGNIVADASEYLNHGILEGARRTRDGRFGEALLFDGQDDAVIIPHSPALQLKTAFTLEAWVRPDRRQTSWPAVIEKEGDLYFLYADSNTGDLVPAGGGVFGASNEDVSPARGLEPFRWSHLTVTYDGAVLQMFVDGVLVSSRVRWFGGRTHDVTLAGTSLPPGTVADPGRLKATLENGLPIRLKGDVTEAFHEPTPLLRILNTQSIDLILLAMENHDLILRHATVATSLGLPCPEIRIPDGLRSLAPGSSFDILIRGRSRQRYISINEVSYGPLGFSLGMGWATLLHSQYLPRWLQALLNHAWMVIFAVPFGFWANPRWVLVLTLPLLCGAVGGLPGSLELAPTPLSQWAAIAFGFLGGMLIRWDVS